MECRADGSVPDDQGCAVLSDRPGPPPGDTACQSGHCFGANVMGLIKVGVCGECSEDADCPPGQTCSEPVVDFDTDQMIGSVCQ